MSADKSKSQLGFEEAQRLILDHATEGTQIQKIPLAEADGHVLAEEITAPLDMPAFDKSAMDGFAFRYRDHDETKAFRVVATIAAGDVPKQAIGAGECARIMTGAPVPEGADTVIPVEDTSPSAAGPDDATAGPGGGSSQAGISGEAAQDEASHEWVRFQTIPSRGAHIARQGEDLKKGSVVMHSGKLLRHQEICILAACGWAEAPIHMGPSIAFAATGEELVEPGASEASDGGLEPGQIYNSNAYNLWSQILAAKARPHYLGILPDRLEILRERIQEGLTADFLILSGGVSMGRFDYIPQVLEELGVELYMEKLLVQPGRPTVFGKRGRTMVFGLPGNPISTLYAFDQYVAPAVRKFRHHPRPQATRLTGELAETVTKKAGRLNLVACTTEWSDGRFVLTPLKTHGSADIFAISGADAIALIPAGVEKVDRGQMVAFRRLYD